MSVQYDSSLGCLRQDFILQRHVVSGIERGPILPYTWLSGTGRNLFNELYFGIHDFSLDLSCANLSSCISYLIPTHILKPHHIEIFHCSCMPYTFTSLGLCTQFSSLHIVFPFHFYPEENYSFSKNLIKCHFLGQVFLNSLDN